MDIADQLFQDNSPLGDEIEALLESENVQIPESEHQKYVTSLGLKIQHTEATYRALEAKYKPIMERMQADLDMIKKREARLKTFVSLVLPPGPLTEYVDDNVRFFYLVNSRTKIVAPDKIPPELCITRTEPSITLIEKRMDEGHEVYGAERITTYSLQVKPGGVKAQKNAAIRQRNLRKKLNTNCPTTAGGLEPSDVEQ